MRVIQEHHHYRQSMLCPLQDEGLSQLSTTDPVMRDLTLFYASQFLNFFAPPNPLSSSAALLIPRYPFRSSNWPSVTCPPHDVICLGPSFSSISTTHLLSGPLCCLLILQCYSYHFSFQCLLCGS